MKKIFNKIWNTSPKIWMNKFIVFVSYQFSEKRRNGVVCKFNHCGVDFSLLMPFPVPEEYKSMINGSYEDVITKDILQNTSAEEFVIWDIGAHIGYQSLIFSSMMSTKTKVLSFEPNPSNDKWFKSNMSLNPKYSESITLYEKALSDKKEMITFNISDKNDATSSGGYIDNTTPPLPDNSYKNFKQIVIETDTIDNLINIDNLSIPNLIKIDVEGAEFNVLKGGINTIKKYKPELIIEIHNIPMMFYVGEFLKEQGYTILILDEKNNNIQTKIIYAKQ